MVGEARAHIPRLVLDTNAVLDWLLFGDARMASTAAALAEGRSVWLATPPMRTELTQVLARPALARYDPDCERILTRFDELVLAVDTAVIAGSPRLRCRDTDDQPFIDLAFHARPATLLTHDRDLLALARRARTLGVTITQPS